ncbi:hypothetical protein BB559_006624 [Furculomyces boomerangus]|uniref:Uncharacterized protein n=1 Tax=Furculomyces boomerangus TaxID=61424 RepID=A0A2T9Y1E6_9FUNG|nr:hypothetical protein BB559_006624 [Furculomyces boomerangus]
MGDSSKILLMVLAIFIPPLSVAINLRIKPQQADVFSTTPDSKHVINSVILLDTGSEQKTEENDQKTTVLQKLLGEEIQSPVSKLHVSNDLMPIIMLLEQHHF